MNEYFQTNKRSMILLTILFLLLALVLYLMLLRPLSEDLKRQEKNISQAESDQEHLEETLKILNLQADDGDFQDLMLEKIIPKERGLDEYILSLQELELTTNSKIEQIHFVYDSQIADHEQAEEEDSEEATSEADSEEETSTEEAEADTAAEDADADADAEEEAEDSTEEADDLSLEPTFIFERPEGLQTISVRIVAASPNYDEFIKLLKAIEAQERLSIVSQLKFDHPTEMDEHFSEEASEDITFEIELTTFYYDN